MRQQAGNVGGGLYIDPVHKYLILIKLAWSVICVKKDTLVK